MIKKRVLLVLVITLSTWIISGDDIVNWQSEFEVAKEIAKKDKKNIFILITAPSWCGWCVKLEENVLSTELFKQKVTKDYVPLMLLDKIDGKRNKELEKFDFRGYPTVMIYDADGNFVDDIYTQDSKEMVRLLDLNKNKKGEYKPLLKDLILPEKYVFEDYDGGSFTKLNDSTWSMKTKDGEVKFYKLDHDYDYIYLEDENYTALVALPIKGNQSYLKTNSSEDWIKFFIVSRE